MKKGTKKVILVIILCTILLFSSKVYARDNYAYAGGIQHNMDQLIGKFDAYDDCINAMRAYDKAGYRIGGHLNPNKTILWENLYATVQFLRVMVVHNILISLKLEL